MAEKFAENDKPNDYKAKIYTSLAFAHNSLKKDSEDAVKFAKKALEFDGLCHVIKKKSIQIFRKFHQDTLETTDIYMNFLKRVRFECNGLTSKYLYLISTIKRLDAMKFAKKASLIKYYRVYKKSRPFQIQIIHSLLY